MKLLLLTALVSFATASILLGQAPRIAGTTGTDQSPSARAQLVDPQGRSVGDALLRQTPHGVLLTLNLRGVPAGVHGLHIHETGHCDAPSFESAGGHFNPTKREHGFLDPRGPHAGDLPNIHVPGDIPYSVEYLIDEVTLDRSANTLLDNSGSAIVIHAGRDNYASDPAGKAGPRLACGRIER